MTLIVGIRCQDGIVLASDSAATFGTAGRPTIGQQEMQKVYRLNDHMLFSSTGAVGISQLIADKVKDLWTNGRFTSVTSPDVAMDGIGKEIVQLVGPYLQTANLTRSLTGDASSSLCKCIVAMPVNKAPYLFTFDFNGAPERSTADLPFVSLGSGQPIADPFLALLRRLLWTGREPTVAEGRLAAVWTIEHVCHTNPGGVWGKVQLATLTTVPGKLPTVIIVSDQDIQEHLQRVASAENILVAELRGLPRAPTEVPTLPTLADAPHP